MNIGIGFGVQRHWAPAELKTARLLVCLLGFSLVTACNVNPATGERQLLLISESQEIALGRQSAEQVRQTMALVQDPELQAYVARLGQQLAAQSERPGLPWSFAVVDDPIPNAFALPGGPVFVTRGLLTLMDSEAELVSVLGHEIGHITARHSVAQISRAQLAQLGWGIGAILVPEIRPYQDIAGLGLNMLMLKYSRDAERQADTLGFRYAREQGYDLAEMADVFASLQRAGELAGQSAIPNWMATHPAPRERIDAVQARLRNLPDDPFEATVGRAEFLAMIEGLAYGENPRNGFFRDNVFYHPELAFQFAVPAQWQRQNLARAVQGISPGQDAVFQFTLVDAPSPDDALQRFAAQEGLQTGYPQRQTSNGIPSVVANFQAASGQNTLAGYAAFFQLNTQTYQLVTYTSSQAFNQYAKLFQDIIDSFAPLKNPAILNIQPPTIQLLRLPKTMTFKQFASNHSPNLPLDQLALINQIQNVNTTLSAGTLMKQVQGEVFTE